MKRWEDFLKEEPTQELSASIDAQVLAEMKATRSTRRWWMQLAGVSLTLAAVVGGYRLVAPRRDDFALHAEAQLLELAEDENLDLEALEDLDVIEILQELEEWQNG